MSKEKGRRLLAAVNDHSLNYTTEEMASLVIDRMTEMNSELVDEGNDEDPVISCPPLRSIESSFTLKGADGGQIRSAFADNS